MEQMIASHNVGKKLQSSNTDGATVVV